MGTNVYMRRIPTAEQKEELKRLLKKQYEDTIASIDRDDYVTCMEDGWTGKTNYEHITPEGLRFSRDADFC